MPPGNEERRRALADAAVALVVRAGVHGVTHRAVERTAGLPTGTASNYFRTRDALLVGAAERVVALHRADMDTVVDAPAGTGLADLLAASLLAAATTHRARYLAILELQLEASRRPVLAVAMADLIDAMPAFTVAHHAELGLDVDPARVPALVQLYGGLLVTLVTAPAGTVDAAAAQAAAEMVVRGASL